MGYCMFGDSTTNNYMLNVDDLYTFTIGCFLCIFPFHYVGYYSGANAGFSKGDFLMVNYILITILNGRPNRLNIYIVNQGLI